MQKKLEKTPIRREIAILPIVYNMVIFRKIAKGLVRQNFKK